MAVKIFRFDTTNFTRIKEYIVSDPRFPSISSKHRALVFLWCRKEYQNLLRAHEAGLRVPKPIDYKKNVILMEFIGENEAAFQTADKNPPENPQEWYEKLSVFYRKLVKVRMIHADFSKYNIINAGGEPVVIDWAQAVLTKHNYALKYLKRDILNFNRWFKGLGAKVNEELFNELKSEIYV
jgi:RIO kinase 1